MMRAASPTNTAYSTYSYSGRVDSRTVAKTHYDELSSYLAIHIAKETPNSRSSAREKLTRLTKQQFQELSTDVYDELLRRKGNSESNDVPFLPVRSDFHPKRNQARQKLATLSMTRFKDLSSDVLYELGRRYPEFREPPLPQPPSLPTEEDEPSPDFPVSSASSPPPSSSHRRIPSQRTALRRPSEDNYGRRSEENYRRGETDLYRRPSDANTSTATATVVIPTKSTITEETIDVPSFASPELDPDSSQLSHSQLSHHPPPPPNEDEPTYFDNMSLGRTSVASASDREREQLARSASRRQDSEEVRREYEFKLATLQKRLGEVEMERDTLQVDLDELRSRTGEIEMERDALQTDLAEFRSGAGERERSLQRELDETHDELASARSAAVALTPADADNEMLEQLRGDLDALVEEVSGLNHRNEELMKSKDADHTLIKDLNTQLKEYKRKYESAKTELRGMKATSQLFVQRSAPVSEDQLPTSADGGLLDSHLTAFLTSIDALLTAGRAPAPTRVLAPMKSVVTTVSALLDDVRSYERSHPTSSELPVLRERAEATLANLVAAARTHATSAGMAPVSLLDAAASHVSATITEIGKLILVKKANAAERGAAGRNGNGNGSISFGLNGLRSLSPTSPSPPPISSSSYPTSTLPTSPSATPSTSDDPWTELKPYLEAQSESVVYAIQSVLSAVRSPSPSPPQLSEHLTQIITIVSSIVAVTSDSLPDGSRVRGGELLRELSEHCTRLGEAQANLGAGAQGEVSKETRQVMAKSAFGVANAMKGLMKL